MCIGDDSIFRVIGMLPIFFILPLLFIILFTKIIEYFSSSSNTTKEGFERMYCQQEESKPDEESLIVS